MKRSSTSVWYGSGKEGSGHVSAQSRLFEKASYSYHTRFENEIGTNPEELLAAAHGSCFSMKLSFILNDAGFVPDVIETVCTVTMEKGVITESHLEVKAKVPGISREKFEECAENARANCPMSKALSLKITMEASLLEMVPA